MPVSVQAEYDAMAEQIAYNNGRVAAFSQYLLEDDPIGGAPGASANGGTVGFQTGLEYANGKPKPLYYGWPVPLVVSKHHHGYSLWGLVRPAGEGHHGDRAGAPQGILQATARCATVSTNSAGYWTPQLDHAGEPLARALGEPRQACATKARRSTPTDGGATRATGCSGRRGGPTMVWRCRSCPR